MERASRVMYTIANFFTWLLVALCTVGVVFSILVQTGAIAKTADNQTLGQASTLVYLILVIVVSLITICLVKIAKDKRSSKGWDILFIVLGVLGSNPFYILGGIFGVVAVRR